MSSKEDQQKRIDTAWKQFKEAASKIKEQDGKGSSSPALKKAWKEVNDLEAERAKEEEKAFRELLKEQGKEK